MQACECGTTFSAGANFCVSCGARIQESPQVFLPAIANPSATNTSVSSSTWRPAGGTSSADAKRANLRERRRAKYSEQVRSRLARCASPTCGSSPGGAPALPRVCSPPPFSLTSPSKEITMQTSQEWCERHHVVSSRSNVRFPKIRRFYFDVLPQVTVRLGQYVDVPLYRPQDDTVHGAEHLLKWRQQRFPFREHFGMNGDAGQNESNTLEVPRGVKQPDLVLVSAAAAEAAAAASARMSVERTPRTSKMAQNMWLKTKTAVKMTAVMSTSENTGRPKGMSKVMSLQTARAKALKRTRLASLPNAKPLALFLDWTESTRRNLIQVWKLLDRDMDMKLSRAEFMRGVKDIGYRGDVSALFNVFDRDQNSQVSFLHFAAEHGLRLADFKYQATERFGSLAACFKAFDADRSGSLSLEEFALACERERFDVPADILFAIVDDPEDTRGSRGKLSVSEFDFLDRWEVPEYLWQDSDIEAGNRFKATLTKRSGGNALVAWRRNFAKDGNMRLSYFEFVEACKRFKQIGVDEASPAQGPVSVWAALDTNRSGWIGIHEWDEEAGHVLSSFVIWAKEKFGRVSAALGNFKPSESGVSRAAFRREMRDLCDILSITHDQIDFLFEGLSMNNGAGTGYITRNKLIVLDGWDPQAERQEAEAWAEIVRQNLIGKTKSVTQCA